VPTKVLVRAVSRDAKIIGDGVGGARITIRHATSGEVLAQGIQRGPSTTPRAPPTSWRRCPSSDPRSWR
jgi:hypothetical protein